MDSFESRMNPRFLEESEKGILWEPNRIREGNGRRFQGRWKRKEKSLCFVVIQFELIFGHSCFYVVCACIEFFGEVGHFTERSRFLELCVISKKLMVYRVVSYNIGERCSVQDKENGPQYWDLCTPYTSCDGNKEELLTELVVFIVILFKCFSFKSKLIKINCAIHHSDGPEDQAELLKLKD